MVCSSVTLAVRRLPRSRALLTERRSTIENHPNSVWGSLVPPRYTAEFNGDRLRDTTNCYTHLVACTYGLCPNDVEHKSWHTRSFLLLEPQIYIYFFPFPPKRDAYMVERLTGYGRVGRSSKTHDGQSPQGRRDSTNHGSGRLGGLQKLMIDNRPRAGGIRQITGRVDPTRRDAIWPDPTRPVSFYVTRNQPCSKGDFACAGRFTRIRPPITGT